MRICQARTGVAVTLSLVLLAPILWSPLAFALHPSMDVSQYAHSAWTIQEGSLKGAVRSIAQTPDGYLWLGTEFGLTRFDGAQFVAWNPPPGERLPSTNIRSLAAARDGTLWIGTLEGLASWNKGKLTSYTELAGQNVLTLLEDDGGTIWAGTFQVPAARLCAIQSGKVHCDGQDRSFGEWVYSLYEDGEHRIWVGAETGLWRWRPGPPKRYPMPHPIESSQALAAADDRSGVLAIGEDVWRLADQKIIPYRMATPPARVMPINMFRDRDGALWVGTLQRGLLHVHEGRTSVFGQSDGLSSNRVLCFFQDREGNIWVGTSEGLDRFRETSIFSISEKEGLSAPSVVSVLAARDNSVWLSSLDGLNRWKNGQVTIYWPGGHGTKDRARSGSAQETKSSFYTTDKTKAVTEIADSGLPDNTVGSLYEDQRGRVWVSAPKGISRFENGRFTLVKELPGGWVNAITGDTRAGIWISYESLGLLHWVDNKVVDRVPWSRFGGQVVASSVMPDPVRGGLWLGFFQGGLVYFKDGQVRASYGRKDGLGGGRVRGLQLDPDGTLWSATEGGLSRLKDGKIATLSSSNGLPCETVHWIAEADGSFWLYTACGLVRIPWTEMDKWVANPAARIQCTVFDRSDGVRSRALLTGYTPLVSKSADGRLWFTNLDSVSVLDPRNLSINNSPPPVRIEQLIADGKSYLPRRGVPVGDVRLPARLRDLIIDFAALSFAVPEKVRFRYKLEGQDPAWREVINDRRVQYSNLAPRHYTFRVMACNNSGVWNESGASLEFSVLPAYYQTTWFRALCLGVFLGVLWAFHRLHVRHLHQKFAMVIEARVNERTRIARDLHDTLLQSFQSVLMKFQVATDILPEKVGEARNLLETATEQARKAIVEGRNVVQGLRASTIVPNELARDVGKVGEELAALSSDRNCPEFRVVVEGTSREIVPIIRDEIYRIGCEGLRNAFKHAYGQHIEVELCYAPRSFQLRVRDDGRGVDPKVLAQGGRPEHYGLPGMQERARLVGGKLSIRTAPGSGTEIELSIPASIAYLNAAQRQSRAKRA